MGTIFSNPNLLKETLFVFWANEEISYDRRPAYRCKGARMFEKKYLHLLVRAKKIIVIDGIGKGLAQWVTSQELTSVFWINQLKELQHKIKRL
ncbi:MAG: hypothetical protein LBP53_04535 [Candidatus Peribacteria bacterium]|jgi:hypothetical protein|nr:hypothetical protein [Candidatus Peribacteria bacterium]